MGHVHGYYVLAGFAGDVAIPVVRIRVVLPREVPLLWGGARAMGA